MFLIKTRVGPSQIHGNGVFACEAVAAGEIVWRFHPPFDQIISKEDLERLPPAAREFIDTYSYHSLELGGEIVLSGDNAKFLNHSSDPNTEERPFRSIARRAIAIGDEITCDYNAFCSDGAVFETDAAVQSSSPAKPLPHEHLYTRIQGCAEGVGVFAIRDIPAGTVLFASDTAETTRLPAQQVDAIQDEEIRRMYLDFCPLVEGDYIAPKDFNLLTMGWYLNHSDEPNVAGDDSLQFKTRRFIAKGEELRSDYTAYSEHAAIYARQWKKRDVRPTVLRPVRFAKL